MPLVEHYNCNCSSFLPQEEKHGAFERAEELQKQFNDLHKDHEKLRKAHMLELPKKVCVDQSLHTVMVT